MSLNELRALFIPRHLRRAAANASRFYGGPPFGREPHPAPELYDPKRDLDGMEHAARIRAQALKMRKQASIEAAKERQQ